MRMHLAEGASLTDLKVGHFLVCKHIYYYFNYLPEKSCMIILFSTISTSDAASELFPIFFSLINTQILGSFFADCPPKWSWRVYLHFIRASPGYSHQKWPEAEPNEAAALKGSGYNSQPGGKISQYSHTSKPETALNLIRQKELPLLLSEVQRSGDLLSHSCSERLLTAGV